MRPMFALAVLSLAATAVTPARADELDRMFRIGADFCFSRTYTGGHLARHPRQSVAAIAVMGRNAHRTAAAPGADATEKTVSGLNVRASLRVTFRDGATRDWPGTCHEDDQRPEFPVICRFVPHRNADSVEFALRLRREGAKVRAQAVGDITHFRRAPDDGAAPERSRSDDAAFDLAAASPVACAYPARFWTRKGATRALEEALP